MGAMRVTRRHPGAARPGRDRRATLLPGPAGAPSAAALGLRPRVAVVGGGIAGVTAAVALAERGVGVHLFEREADLGGRLRGWAPTETDVPGTMTRGFHAFFRQYYNLRALLRRIDPELGMLRPLADYPLEHRSGARDSFAGLPTTPPWNMISFVLRSPTFRLRDLTRMDARAAMGLFDVSVPRSYAELDDLDAVTYLDRIGFPTAARDLAFEVFSRSFFADPRQLSAAELATMFHLYFLGSSEGLLFDVARAPFPTVVWQPLRRHLEGLGAELSTGTGVQRIVRHGEGFLVEADTGSDQVDDVVLAADVHGLRDLVASSPTLGDPPWRARVGRLRTAPPFLVSKLWLDRPARPDRPAFLGTAGFDLLDNVSLLERFDDEAAQWHRETGGSVVELHAYALPADPEDGSRPVAGQEQLAERLRQQLGRVYPELGGAEVLHAAHVVAADCPLFPPRAFRDRPGVSTSDPALVLAGDLTRVDLPVALMERAATTGFLAANALLSRHGVQGHDVWSIGNQGFSPVLRRLSRAAAGPRAQRAAGR